ncbi:unnamed protein product [Linum tenue]|uniref:Uncharacterized protein n=1 Tax=Linum tenue TaxID=586396 RepID=A0AAV0MM81_9ROSI|nr:unnamed protein product [Linum tenue]
MVEFTGCQEEEEGGTVQALRHGRKGEVVFKEELSLGQANLLQNHPWLLMMINLLFFYRFNVVICTTYIIIFFCP